MDKMLNFPTEGIWNDFVNTLDLDNPQIALLVEECNILRQKLGEYYEYWVLMNL